MRVPTAAADRARAATRWLTLARRARATVTVGVAVGAVLVAACGGGAQSAAGGKEARTAPSRSELPAAVTAQLDSGTAAYREGDYGAARRHYRAATEEDPDLASAWFGVMMAERALGNDAVADSIQVRLGASGLTDPHHGGSDTPRSMNPHRMSPPR